MNRRELLTALLALPIGLNRAFAACEVVGAPSSKPSVVVPSALDSLFVIGDWGTGGSLQKKVARAMNETALAGAKPLAVVSVGDNIYPSGVQSATDGQWKSKYEDVYALSGLDGLDWIAVLGNHDYRGSVTAQIEYGKANRRWKMPAPYYVMPCVQRETILTLFCLDTQQILQKTSGWKDQLAWLENELTKCNTPWKVVVGHHPMRSYGHYQDQAWMLEHVKPLLDSARVQAYLCGHDHDLQIVKNQSDSFTCIVSGGGGGCRSTVWGRNTQAAWAGGGFCTLHFSGQEMYASIVDATGLIQGAVQIPQHN